VCGDGGLGEGEGGGGAEGNSGGTDGVGVDGALEGVSTSSVSDVFGGSLVTEGGGVRDSVGIGSLTVDGVITGVFA